MNEAEFALDIWPAHPDELELLQSTFSPRDFAGHHFARFRVQAEGKGVYLIAWHGDEPVGHFLLHWEGPETDSTARYPYSTPYLEAGQTRLEFRRKGVATRFIREAEILAKERGYRAIGLAVGRFGNPDAKRLYETLGYRDWERGDFFVSWRYRDAEGNEGVESELCIYLFKSL